ncbi:MAG: hypothetical protein C0425_10100 [Chlorobiaceae bacterium]|nr:hypothetical protein [Chlorobiaceae bacterium]
MITYITPDLYEQHRDLLKQSYQLRYRVFCEKKQWDISAENGQEKDEYDEKNMHYLIYQDDDGIVRGCLRFIEMIHPCMLEGPFNFALPNVKDFKKKGYWESTRFAIEPNHHNTNIARLFLAKLIEIGLSNQEYIEGFFGISFPSVKRLFNKYGLFTFDINTISIDQDTTCIWLFPPMHLSLEKLLRN